MCFRLRGVLWFRVGAIWNHHAILVGHVGALIELVFGLQTLTNTHGCYKDTQRASN
ncbi:DUF6552 family protein [Shimia sp. MMG029]|uniref:DUF6552 family protein n=1 Tax=Shimia sp. MMG029 TaxID=3021978 RepID=UPI003F8F6D31